jgi:hypothetical protein
MRTTSRREALTHGSPIYRSACIERLLTIAVSNGGEAIPPKTMERLFQFFFRGGTGRQAGRPRTRSPHHNVVRSSYFRNGQDCDCTSMPLGRQLRQGSLSLDLPWWYREGAVVEPLLAMIA